MPADPVDKAYEAIRGIFEGLTRKQRNSLHEKLNAARWYSGLTAFEILKAIHKSRSRTADEELNNQVIQLRDEDKKSFGEIGKQLKCSADAARKRYRRAKEKKNSGHMRNVRSHI
jgi:hypothetical protein